MSYLDALNKRFPLGANLAPTYGGAISAGLNGVCLHLLPPFTEDSTGYITAWSPTKGADVAFKANGLRDDGRGVVVDTGPGEVDVFLWPYVPPAGDGKE